VKLVVINSCGCHRWKATGVLVSERQALLRKVSTPVRRIAVPVRKIAVLVREIAVPVHRIAVLVHRIAVPVRRITVLVRADRVRGLVRGADESIKPGA
jgi:hypothetical protein